MTETKLPISRPQPIVAANLTPVATLIHIKPTSCACGKLYRTHEVFTVYIDPTDKSNTARRHLKPCTTINPALVCGSSLLPTKHIPLCGECYATKVPTKQQRSGTDEQWRHATAELQRKRANEPAQRKLKEQQAATAKSDAALANF